MKKILKSYFKSYNKENDTIEFIASTGSVDREGESIDPNGWDLSNIGKNLPLLWAHDSRELPIGKVIEAKVENNSLIAIVEFAHKVNDFAKKVYELVKAGFLNAASVGFLPKAYDAEGKMTQQEFLELSIVNIPANQEALRSNEYQSFIKSLEEMEKKEIDLHKKPEETDEYIRIPTGIDCDVTATIDIDKEKGIKALYCGKDKEIRTYLFLKEKGWTMEKAKKWVEEHKKEYAFVNKEGRIISEKNRTVMRVAIDSMSQATKSLGELLNQTEPPAKKGGVNITEGKIKLCKKEKQIYSAARIVDKAVEVLIHTLKEGGEKE